MIYYNSNTINDWNFGDDNIAKVYYGVTSALPYDAEIEYLQSSGTQYINTNIYLNPSNFEVGYNILGNSVKWGYTHQGSGAGTWITVESSTAFFGNYNNGRVTITTDSTENVIKYVSTSGITVNGTSYSKTFAIGSDSIASIPLYLFVMYDFRSGMDYSSSAKVKSFYVKNDGELVLDMIPVRVGQVGYMYDRVSGQLFGNDGTGDFILGADKSTPSSSTSRLPQGYTEVEYIRHSNDVKVKNVWSVPNDAVEGNIYTVDLLLDSASQQNVSRYIGLFGWGTGYCQRTNRAAGDETNVGYRHSDGWYGDSTIGNYYQEYDVKLRYRMTPTSLAITNTQTSGVTTINLPYKDSGSSTGGNFGVFSYTGSDNGSYQMRGNIYQIIIEGSDNTIKHQYIPCQRDSDSKYGLYDLVGQEFYYPTTITISGGSAVTPSSSTSRLPSGYTEVECVQNNTQGAYINTGLLLYDATGNSFSISAKLKSQYESTWEGDGYYLQTIINSEDVSSPYYGFTFRYAWKTHILECSSNPSNSVTFSSTANTDGTSSLTINCNSTTVTNQVPLGLFASYNGNYNTPYRFSNATIYSFQVTKNNTLVRDLVPCIRDNDNMVGMYDVVNDVFYYPPNYQSYQLVAGSAVTPSSMSGNVVYQKITNGSTPPTPPTPIDYANEYLTFVAQTDGVTIGLNDARSNVFQYSLDSGSTWNNLVNKQSTPSINNGDKIMFKASGLSVYDEKGIGRLHPSASASVEGNVMSLIYGDDFSGQTAIPNNFQLRRLFSGATNLTSAENFVIPATSLRKQCYSGMFQACTSLTKTPKAIGSSAMTLNGGDYVMSDMFHGCTSLTTVSSGLLPALNLGNQCYWYMFEDCSSLTETPHLLATEAATQCYQGMFKNCSSLNNVTCLLRNPSTYSEWLDGVAANGTFYKNSNASWSSGSNGIPTNWTVVDYTT